MALCHVKLKYSNAKAVMLMNEWGNEYWEFDRSNYKFWAETKTIIHFQLVGGSGRKGWCFHVEFQVNFLALNTTLVVIYCVKVTTPAKYVERC